MLELNLKDIGNLHDADYSHTYVTSPTVSVVGYNIINITFVHMYCNKNRCMSFVVLCLCAGLKRKLAMKRNKDSVKRLCSVYVSL